jgi:hypothetical protein
LTVGDMGISCKMGWICCVKYTTYQFQKQPY